MINKKHKFINKSVFLGDNKELKIISNNLIYPEKALINKIEGNVYLNYKINQKV